MSRARIGVFEGILSDQEAIDQVYGEVLSRASISRNPGEVLPRQKDERSGFAGNLLLTGSGVVEVPVDIGMQSGHAGYKGLEGGFNVFFS
jgi:hypothetical protein